MKMRTAARVQRSEVADGTLSPAVMQAAQDMAWRAVEDKLAGEGHKVRGKVYFVGLIDLPDDPDHVGVNFECETSRRA